MKAWMDKIDELDNYKQNASASVDSKNVSPKFCKVMNCLINFM